MRLSFLYILLSTTACFLIGQEKESSDSVATPEGVNADLFNSSFFDGVLDQADTGDDAMGTQRLIDLRGSTFSPSISFSTNYNYSSNPLKAASGANGYKSDGFSATLNLMINLGLGEIGIGDEVLLTPSLAFAQMRTYTDPVRDFGNQMKAFDVDVQILSLAMPFVLPNDFTLSVGHAYTRPISFRDDNIISYSNTPSLSLSKNFTMPNGDIFNFMSAVSYSFTNGDTLRDQITDPEYYNFIEAVMGGAEAVLAQQPTSLQDAWTHTISSSYMHPLTEKLMVMPNFNFSKMIFTKGGNTGREDYLTSAGINFSYAFAEWLNFSTVSNYTWKKTDSTGTSLSVPEYEDFIGGVAFGINYAF
jgi:hypothetical protein